MNDLINILSRFHTYALSEEKEIGLMKRIDNKYVFRYEQLNKMLIQSLLSYKRLNINDELFPAYDTFYYDTSDFEMYRFHHNGKANRFKIRHRKYINSNTGFLEIKHKNNQKLIKKIRINQTRSDFINNDNHFIAFETPYTPEQLKPSVSTRYKRITLSDFTNSERVTIDFNLGFSFQGNDFIAENLVICEIKKNLGSKPGNFENILKNTGIKPFTISKYCLGNYFLNDKVKKNLFKEKAEYINKIINTI